MCKFVNAEFALFPENIYIPGNYKWEQPFSSHETTWRELPLHFCKLCSIYMGQIWLSSTIVMWSDSFEWVIQAALVLVCTSVPCGLAFIATWPHILCHPPIPKSEHAKIRWIYEFPSLFFKCWKLSLFPPWWKRGSWWKNSVAPSCSILKICWGLCYLGYHRERCSWLLGGPDWMDGRDESHWGRTRSWCMKYLENWEVASCIHNHISINKSCKS